ncbi:hypothetical protein Dsin_009496 [Dipteronia sinensis]|uniref:Protein FAR1-RELATED SEQUENCE n=1 Tax=Dipteronia sinensis TaxID=43782 RepID=A0AAE0EBT2_9ROSI|nr:hypothetical protein Dsin_009496 [Dipteronia sinensis]
MSKELEGHDTDLLYEHFVSKQEKNPAFSFAIKKCQEDRLTHCFWADVKSKRAYKYFGDVVVFDNTYNYKSICEDVSKSLEDILNSATLDIKSTSSSGGSGGVSERDNVVQHVYNEPLAVRIKGCGKRLKRGKEKAKNKTNDRVCNNDTTNLTAEDEDSISSTASNSFTYVSLVC